MTTKKAQKKTAKKSTTKQTSKAKTVKAKKVGVGQFCKDLIMSGNHSREEVLQKTAKEFPDSAVSQKHISYYVWALKKQDKIVPAFKE